MSELKQTMQRAREFIAANLAECCRDELDWQKSSILRDGKLREAAAIFGEVDKTHAIPMAQSETARQAMQLACRAQPEANADAKDAKVVEWIRDVCTQIQYDIGERIRTGQDEKFYTFTLNEMSHLMPILKSAIDAARQAKESGNG